jgi:hypothetical protein
LYRGRYQNLKTVLLFVPLELFLPPLFPIKTSQRRERS